MSTETSAAPKLPRRFKFNHPAWWLVWPVEGSIIAGLGALMYIDLLSMLGAPRLPGVDPLAAILIGLAGGLAEVAAAIWWLRRYFDSEVRELAFGQRNWGAQAVGVGQALGVFVCTLGAFYLYGRLRPCAGITTPLVLGTFLLPGLFMYRRSAVIYVRAREAWLASSGAPVEAATPTARRGSPGAWAIAVSVILCVGALALGVALQWGIPYLAGREPREYKTEFQLGGVAARLTYGPAAEAAALSPDGRLIACVRWGAGLGNAIEIMHSDGSHKRRASTASDLDVSGICPPAWSLDAKRLLAIGHARKPATSLAAMDISRFSSGDLWVVDAATLKPRRLTKNGHFIAGLWVSRGRLAGLEKHDHDRWARLWLLDERGGNRRAVEGLRVIPKPWAINVWRERGGLLAVGRDELVGIWFVDATSGRATRLSKISARWAVPLDRDNIVFAAPGRAYPPSRGATSIGVVSTAGKVHWVLRDLQGLTGFPSLTRGMGTVVFVLTLNDYRSLWALRLRDGQLRELATGKRLYDSVVSPDGSAVYYMAESGERSRGLLAIDVAVWRLPLGKPLP